MASGFTEVAPDLWSWKQLMHKASPGFDRVESHGEADDFHGSMVHRAVDRVLIDLMEIDQAPPHTVTRSEANIQGADSPIVVFALFDGIGSVRSGDREAEIGAGDMIMLDTALPYVWRFESGYRALSMRMPRSSLGVDQMLVGRLSAVRMTREEGVGALAFPVLAALADNLDVTEGPIGLRVMQNVVDLAGTAFVDHFAATSQNTSRRAQLLGRVIDYITPRLSEPDLSPQSIAEASFISIRHLHSLFRLEGTTVSAWIRDHRLVNARRMLGDPALAASAVREIALAAGFDNAAHFSALFRAAFGESPREWRLRSRAGG